MTISVILSIIFNHVLLVMAFSSVMLLIFTLIKLSHSLLYEFGCSLGELHNRHIHLQPFSPGEQMVDLHCWTPMIDDLNDCTTFDIFVWKRNGFYNFQKLTGLWLVGVVVNPVGMYGSKVAEGLSAFQRRSCFIFARYLCTLFFHRHSLKSSYQVLWLKQSEVYLIFCLPYFHISF